MSKTITSSATEDRCAVCGREIELPGHYIMFASSPAKFHVDCGRGWIGFNPEYSGDTELIEQLRGCYSLVPICGKAADRLEALRTALSVYADPQNFPYNEWRDTQGDPTEIARAALSA